jgi:hypothetical protein
VLSRALAKAVLIEVYLVVAGQQSVFSSTAPQALMPALAPPVAGLLASNDKSGSSLKSRKRRGRKAKQGAKLALCELSEHSRDCLKEHGLALKHRAVHNHNVFRQSKEQKLPPLFKAGFLVFALLVAFVLRMPSPTPAQIPVGRRSRMWRTTAPGSAADANHKVDSIMTSMATTVAQVRSELEKQDEARVKRLQSRLLTHRQRNR